MVCRTAPDLFFLIFVNLDRLSRMRILVPSCTEMINIDRAGEEEKDGIPIRLVIIEKKTVRERAMEQ